MNVLLITDSPIEARALGLLFEQDGRAEIVASVNSNHTVGSSELLGYDAVLVALPFPRGTAAARMLLLRDPRIPVVGCRVAEDEQHVLEWARSGALGCVGESSSLDELVDALQAATRGERCCSSAVGELYFRVAARFAPSFDRDLGLTDRETEIIQFMLNGLSNKQIAQATGIELATVKNHLHNAYRKLGVHTRAQARELFPDTVVRQRATPRAFAH
ncbi:MAG TPA: response regulator transcription factor [Gaiellaceae bacterium]